jgi:hypothetical protein
MAKGKIPSPPDPRRPGEKRPWQTPKSTEEDASALARVQSLLNSASYRQADKDVDFLARYESRGVRLELDYAKAELLLAAHGVDHTIVVFGSARTPEPAGAQRQFEEAERALKSNPDDPALKRSLAVARRVQERSHYYQLARDFGRIVGEFGQGPGDGKVIVMTGGGPGIMEAANRGSFDVQADTAGLNITLPHEQFPNPYITPDLCLSFHYFAVRKLHFLLRAKALVAFPGGFGTLDELFETLTLVQTRTIAPLPIVLAGESFWRRIVDFDALVDEGVIAEEDLNLFWFEEDPQEIWNGILRWHKANGTSLFE